jgi:hypothetical protein
MMKMRKEMAERSAREPTAVRLLSLITPHLRYRLVLFQEFQYQESEYTQRYPQEQTEEH